MRYLLLALFITSCSFYDVEPERETPPVELLMVGQAGDVVATAWSDKVEHVFYTRIGQKLPTKENLISFDKFSITTSSGTFYLNSIPPTINKDSNYESDKLIDQHEAELIEIETARIKKEEEVKQRYPVDSCIEMKDRWRQRKIGDDKPPMYIARVIKNDGNMISTVSFNNKTKMWDKDINTTHVDQARKDVSVVECPVEYDEIGSRFEPNACYSYEDEVLKFTGQEVIEFTENKEDIGVMKYSFSSISNSGENVYIKATDPLISKIVSRSSCEIEKQEDDEDE